MALRQSPLIFMVPTFGPGVFGFRFNIPELILAKVKQRYQESFIY